MHKEGIMRLVPTIMRALMASFAAIAAAQIPAAEFPTKPIRLILATAPGGSPDILARIVCQKLSESLGQQVIIDNRPGAGGTIGTTIAARAVPDGYTLLIGHLGTLGVNPSLYPNLAYDPNKDFLAISQFAKVPSLLVVNPLVPATSVKQLVELAKAKPGTLNYGSAGSGSAAHLLVEYFKLLTKTDIQHVPYRGTSPALIDLLAGQISMTITGVPPLLPHVKAGKLRALGVSTAQRVPQLPDVPTIEEAGVAGYEVTQWYGIVAPAATPKLVIARLNAEIGKVLQLPEVRERFAIEGAEAIGSTPAQFQAFIKSEIERWRPVVKASGARPE